MSIDTKIQNSISLLSSQGIKPSVVLLGSDSMQEFKEVFKNIYLHDSGLHGAQYAQYAFGGHCLSVIEIDHKDKNFFTVH